MPADSVLGENPLPGVQTVCVHVAESVSELALWSLLIIPP